MSQESSSYTGKDIVVLEGLAAVRKRPAMYIGSTDTRGLHHLVYEVVDNAIDEAMAGYCTKVDVILHVDNSVTVRDDGRGIPVDIHPKEKVPAVQVVMTKLHAGGKFDNNAYKVSGGLHGVGVSCVNALSEWLEVTVRRDGKKWRQRYERGTPVTGLEDLGGSSTHGTTVRFLPDSQIFEVSEFSYEILRKRFEELAYLNKGLKIICSDERTGDTHTFVAEGGITQFVNDLNDGKGIHSIISGSGVRDSVSIEFAMQYNAGYRGDIHTFANNIRTVDGGTHLSGFRSALTKSINDYIKEQPDLAKKLKGDALSGDDVREGLTAVISVKIPQPQFEGQTKTKLGNSEVAGITQTLVSEALKEYFHENPKESRVIMDKALLALIAREKARIARETVRRKSSLLDSSLPGKLSDCSSKDPTECEVFIVEGDSAGGSAKKGRNPKTQAILPLRGKILNIEKVRPDKMLANQEIQNMIKVMGIGFGDQIDFEKLRYHKIVIMTDADVDGAHIRTLMMTFFFRHYEELIRRGHLYIAQPPLFRVYKGKWEKYLKDEKDLDEFFLGRLTDGISLVSRSGDEFSGPAFLDILKSVEELQDRFKEAYNMAISHELFEAFLDYPDSKPASEFSRKETPGDFREWMEKCGYAVSEQTEANEDGERYFITFENTGGHRTRLSTDFFGGKIYRKAKECYNGLCRLCGDFPMKLKKGDNTKEVNDFFELRNLAYDEARKGYQIQRYKGLGEMDANQLYDTTMDPENRVLLRVSIGDAESASEAFEQLMGDRVEPRREYIIRNAVLAGELDI
ncbi:MAG: DNA topoisomerase (ATP-hydrolyzing) subunit B [Mailhella sp.]|nr:DNA topoisomerase (ATP-hydrolyzing) subunit B [Mailhella sp.]